MVAQPGREAVKARSRGPSAHETEQSRNEAVKRRQLFPTNHQATNDCGRRFTAGRQTGHGDHRLKACGYVLRSLRDQQRSHRSWWHNPAAKRSKHVAVGHRPSAIGPRNRTSVPGPATLPNFPVHSLPNLSSNNCTGSYSGFLYNFCCRSIRQLG